jgi:hypothetical protein
MLYGKEAANEAVTLFGSLFYNNWSFKDTRAFFLASISF